MTESQEVLFLREISHACKITAEAVDKGIPLVDLRVNLEQLVGAITVVLGTDDPTVWPSLRVALENTQKAILKTLDGLPPAG